MQVYSIQTALHSIDRLNVGCWYIGATAGRPPSASAQHTSPLVRGGAGVYTAMPVSSPLSMQAGEWSDWVGKTQSTTMKSAACPNPQDERKEGQEKISADGPEPPKVHLSFRW